MPDDMLPDAELEVLACLWHRGESTAREVREAIEGFRPMAHASIVTLLGRLEDKGYVRKRKGEVGKAFVYRAARRPAPTQRKILSRLTERVFGGSGVALVASLFESKPPTADEVEELEQLLDDLKRKRRGRGGRS